MTVQYNDNAMMKGWMATYPLINPSDINYKYDTLYYDE